MSALVDRLHSRLSRFSTMADGLRPMSIAGRTVFKGAIADAALDSFKARAATIPDAEGGSAVIVRSGFDPGKPADLALAVHEWTHQDEDHGTGGGTGFVDMAEGRAREAEKMVLQRLDSGEDVATVLADIARGITSPNLPGGERGPIGTMVARAVRDPGNIPNDALAAYFHLRSKGKPHNEVIHDLTGHVMDQIRRDDEQTRWRGGQDEG